MALVAVILSTVIYALLQPAPELLVVGTDSLFVLVPGVCSFLGFLVVKRWGFRGKFGFVHLGLFLAVFIWFVGETVWAVCEVFLNVAIPYPSIADVFYVAGYVPVLAGMLQFIRAFGGQLSRRASYLAVASCFAIIILTGAFLTYPLIIESADVTTKIFDVAYPALDSIILGLAVLMFFIFRGGYLAKSWAWIFLGLFLTSLGDIAFSLGTLQGWYYSGHPVELVYLWGYISIALGFDIQREELLV